MPWPSDFGQQSAGSDRQLKNWATYLVSEIREEYLAALCGTNRIPKARKGVNICDRQLWVCHRGLPLGNAYSKWTLIVDPLSIGKIAGH